MTGVFLSYARSDDEPYVRDLFNHLQADGFDAWFDREHMPSRSLTFLHEIRYAIRQRDRLVIILGPAAVKSDYVRAEWQAALVEGKAVTPILRLGDYQLVPPELKSFHCPDVRAARPAEAALAEVIRILNEPVPPLGMLSGSIPAVPPHFQPRPDDLSQLARTILYEVEHSVVLDPPERTTVLHGMGGAGKSVLAGAFARATSTRRVFGDGILWIELTTSSTPLEALRSVLMAAGQTIAPSAGLSEAVSLLRQWLDQRRCLIIVDNAWSVNQIAPLVQAISPVSRLLVTTRDAGIATSLGANSQSVNALSLASALVQLADWVGLPVEDLPEDARLVAEQCGGLPFALALQGALARDGVPWSDLLDALRDADLSFAKQQLPGYPYLDVLNVIQASVDMLRVMDAKAAARFLELGAFFWNEGVATSALVAFWKSVAGLAERDGRRLLVELQRKALIRVSGTPPFAHVHDLVADYLTASNDLTQLQGVLLDYYRKQCVDGWASGPDDGYFHRHLIDHLAARAGGKQELTELLSSSTPEGRNAWFQASDRTGNVDAYRLQLERLINAPAASLPDVMTLATQIASVNALASNVPPALSVALVRNGEWTVTQAFGYARQCPEPKHRAACLTGLLDYSKDGLRQQVLDECLAAVRMLEEFPSELVPLLHALATEGRTNEALALARRAAHGDGKAGALAAVASHLAGPERETVISEGIEVCATTEDFFRPAAIEVFLPVLNLEELAKFDAMAIEPLYNTYARGWSEVPFITRLIELDDMDAAWTRARKIAVPLSRADAVALCVSRLPVAEREAAVDEVLATIGGIDPDTALDEIQGAFSHLPQFLFDFLPKILKDQPLLLSPFKVVVPCLNDQQITKAVKLLHATTDPVFAAEGAAALAPVISADLCRDLVAELTPRLGEEKTEDRRMRAWSALLSMSPNDQHQELLEAAFADLASLPPSYQASALKNLVPVLRGREIDKALLFASQLSDSGEKSDCVELLIPSATVVQLREARSVVMKIGDEHEALFAAAVLSASLDVDTRRNLLSRSLRQTEYIRARTIALLAPYLDDQSFDKALSAVEQIEDPTSRAEVALPALAKRAPEPQRKQILERAIDIAACMTVPDRRVWALGAMIDQLDQPLRDYAFTRFTAEAPGMDDWRVFGEGIFLAVIAPGMPEPERGELLDRTLALVPQLEKSDLRRDVLSRLAPHLDLKHWTTVIKLVYAEQDPFEQAITAGFLIGAAPKELWPRFVDAALSRIEEIAAGNYGFVGDATEAAGARVLAYSADPKLGLDVVGRFKDEGWKRAALLEFVKTTPTDALDPVLGVIDSLSGPRERASLKLTAAKRLENARREALIAEALADALDGPADLLHDDLLPNLSCALCELPVDRLRELWSKQAPRLSERNRPQLLTIVHGLAPMLVRLELGDPTVRALFDAQRWWP